MAVSPYELEQKFEQNVNIFESMIDDILIKLTLHRNQILRIIAPEGLTDIHMEMLEERYTSVGWESVKLKTDIKDGTYLEFTFIDWS